MQSFIPVFVILVSQFNLNAAAKLPTFLTQCSENSTVGLSQCFQRNANRAIRDIVKGVIHYDIPVMNPLRYPENVVLRDSNLFSITFSDILVFGLQRAQVSNVSFDLNRRRFLMSVNIPNLIFTGNYKSDGVFFGVEIENSGEFVKNFTGVNIDYRFQFMIELAIDGDYFRIINNNTVFNYQSQVLRLDDLFGAEDMIDGIDNVRNNFMERIKELATEQLESLNVRVSKFLTSIFEGIFSRVPRQEIFIQPNRQQNRNTPCSDENSQIILENPINRILCQLLISQRLGGPR